MKYRLQVIAHALNKRNRIPAAFPDDGGIVGVVLQGFSFIGERVLPTELNGTTERWYRDRDGYFYMGRWLIETEELTSSLQVVKEVKAVPVKAAPPSVLPGWLTSLGIDQVWNKTQGENVTIAVLDSGYNTSIEDLKEAVIDAKVFMKSGNPNISVEDKFGHGTHCASLVAARNKKNFTSCAPKASLLIAKITSSGSINSFDNYVRAIEWAIEKKADVISISYGSESSVPELEAIVAKAVHVHNIPVVAAIGNKIEHSTNGPEFPAMLKDCIAVGAVNEHGDIAEFTIQDPKIAINAPGEKIPGYWLLSEMQKKNGTSQATAIVAGIIALIISRHKALGKTYTVKSILDLIEQTAEPLVGSPPQKRIAPLKIFDQI